MLMHAVVMMDVPAVGESVDKPFFPFHFSALTSCKCHITILHIPQLTVQNGRPLLKPEMLHSPALCTRSLTQSVMICLSSLADCHVIGLLRGSCCRDVSEMNCSFPEHNVIHPGAGSFFVSLSFSSGCGVAY